MPLERKHEWPGEPGRKRKADRASTRRTREAEAGSTQRSIRESAVAAYEEEVNRLVLVASGLNAGSAGRCPHCGEHGDSDESLLEHLFGVVMELGADEAQLRRTAREGYKVAVPHLVEIARGETTHSIRDAEGESLEVVTSYCNRIAAFNQLVKGGMGTDDAGREREVLVELRSTLEEEVNAYFGSTLEEIWAQCEKDGTS